VTQTPTFRVLSSTQFGLIAEEERWLVRRTFQEFHRLHSQSLCARLLSTISCTEIGPRQNSVHGN